MFTVPTIIQVNNQNFKYHHQPLLVFLEEPKESVFYVKNPEPHTKKTSSKIVRIEKKNVEFAIKMKVLPKCKHCGEALNVLHVEPYIHENYRITFECKHNQCKKDKQWIYFENESNEEFG